MGDIGSIYAKIGADVSDLKHANTAVTKFAGSFSSTMKGLTTAVFSWQAAVASAVASISFGKVISDAKEFQSAVVDMGKVTKASSASIISDIHGIDAALGSGTQLMKGYYEVLSSGYQAGAQGLDLLTTAAKSSKAAHIDQATTILALTKMMAGYAGQLRSATEASDLLFKIEEIGITKFQELVPVIGSLSNISRVAGLSAKEMGGALALITQTAGSTSEAATELEAMLTALIKPTDDMITLFTEFGGVSKAISQMGLVEVLKKIEAAAGGSTEKLADLLGGRKEALVGFVSLAVNGFSKVTDYIQKMDEATGATQKNWEAFEKSFEGEMDKFWNILSNTIVKAGMEVLPTLGKAFADLGSWIAKNTDGIVASFKAVSHIIQEVILYFKLLVGVFNALPTALLDFLNSYFEALKKSREETEKLTTATKAYSEAADNAAKKPPVTPEHVSSLQTMWKLLDDMGKSMVIWFKDFLSAIDHMITSIVATAVGAFVGMYEVVAAVWTAIEHIVENIGAVLTGQFARAGKAWEALWVDLGSLPTKLKGVFEAWVSTITKSWKTHEEAVAKHNSGVNEAVQHQEKLADATKENLALAKQDVELTNARIKVWQQFAKTLDAIYDPDNEKKWQRMWDWMNEKKPALGKEQLATYRSVTTEIEKLSMSAYEAEKQRIKDEFIYKTEKLDQEGLLYRAYVELRDAQYRDLARKRVELEKRTQSTIASIQDVALQSQSKYLSLTLAGQVELKESAIREKKREIEATHDLAVDAAMGDTLLIAAANADRKKAYAELIGDEIELEEMKRRRILEITTGLTQEMMKDRQAWLDMIGGPAVDAQLAESLHKNEEYAKNVIDNIEKTWDNFIKNTQEKLGDVVYDAMEGNIESWDDLLDTLEDMFKRWLAELIAYAAMRYIVIPVLLGTKGLGGLIKIPGGVDEYLEKAGFGGGGGGITGTVFSSLVSALGDKLGINAYFEGLSGEIWSGISSLFSTPSGAPAYLGDMYAGMSAESLAELGIEIEALGSTASTAAEGMAAATEALVAVSSETVPVAAAAAPAAGTGALAGIVAAGPYVVALLAIPAVIGILGKLWDKLVGGHPKTKTVSMAVPEYATRIGVGSPYQEVSGAQGFLTGKPMRGAQQTDIDLAIQAVLQGAQKYVVDLVRALPPALGELVQEALKDVTISTAWSKYVRKTEYWMGVVGEYANYIAGQVNAAVNTALKGAFDKLLTPVWEDMSGAFDKLTGGGRSDSGLDAFISKAEVLAAIGKKIDAFDFAGALTYYQDALKFTGQLVAAGDEMGFVTERFVKSVHDLVAAGDFVKAAEQIRVARDFVDTLLVAVQPTKQFDVALRTLNEEFGVIAAKAAELGVSLTLVAEAQEKAVAATLEQRDAYIKSTVGLTPKGFISGSIGDALESVGKLFADWKKWFVKVNAAAEEVNSASGNLSRALGGPKQIVKIEGVLTDIASFLKAYDKAGNEVKPVRQKILGKWVDTFKPVMDMIDHFELSGAAFTKAVEKVYSTADYAKLEALNQWADDYKEAVASTLIPTNIGTEFVDRNEWIKEHPILPLPELPFNEVEDWFVAFDSMGKKIEPIIDAAGKRSYKGLEGTIAYFEFVGETVMVSEDVAPTEDHLKALDAVNKWLRKVREGTATLEDLIELTPMEGGIDAFVGAVEEFVDAFNIASLGTGPAAFVEAIRQANTAIKNITVTFEALEYAAGDAATGVLGELEKMSTEALTAARKYKTSVIEEFFSPIQDIIDQDTLGEVGYQIKVVNDTYKGWLASLASVEEELDPEVYQYWFDAINKAWKISLDKILKDTEDVGETATKPTLPPYTAAREEIKKKYYDYPGQSEGLFGDVWRDFNKGLINEAERIKRIAALYVKFNAEIDILNAEFAAKFAGVMDPIRDIINDSVLNEYTIAMRDLNSWYEEQKVALAGLADYLMTTTKSTLAYKKAVDELNYAMNLQVKGLVDQIMDPVRDIIAKGTLSDYDYQMRQINLWYKTTVLNITSLFATMAATQVAYLKTIGITLEGLLAEILDAFNIQIAELNASIVDTTDSMNQAAESFKSISSSSIKSLADLRAALSSLSLDISSTDVDVRAAARENAKELITEYLTPFTKDIERFIDSLTMSELAPVQSMEAMQGRYEELLAKSRAGDVEAVSELQSFVDSEYLPFLQTFTAASGNYNEVFQGVLDDLKSIGTSVVGSIESMDFGRSMTTLIRDALTDMDLTITQMSSVTVYTTGMNIYGSIPGTMFAQSGGYFGGLTNLTVGEKGGEWVVPTYEPERSAFLRDVGVDVGGISQSVARAVVGAVEHAGEGGGGLGAGVTERQPIYLSIDGKVVAGVVVEQGRKNGQYVRSIRRLARHAKR